MSPKQLREAQRLITEDAFHCVMRVLTGQEDRSGCRSDLYGLFCAWQIFQGELSNFAEIDFQIDTLQSLWQQLQPPEGGAA